MQVPFLRFKSKPFLPAMPRVYIFLKYVHIPVESW